MTATQIKRLAKQVEESTDKAEQREIRTKLVALLNNVYVVEQLFYLERDAVSGPLEVALRNLFRDCNRVREDGKRDEWFSATADASAPWLDECNGRAWLKLAR